LSECGKARFPNGIVFAAAPYEHADTPYPIALLRARRKRPAGGRAANHFDEISPAHCIPEARDHAFGF